MKKRILTDILCVIFVCIALFAGYQLLKIHAEYKMGTDAYQELEQFITFEDSVPAPDNPKQESDSEQDGAVSDTQKESGKEGTGEDASDEKKEPKVYAKPTVDFASLTAMNSDTVGWIYIGGTKVNYPIVQAEDNDYYLTRMVDGRYNSAGSIFLDYRNSADFSDRHTIIHGHHMKNGSMFSALSGYKDQEFYDEHPTYMIITPDADYTVEVICAYVTDAYDDAWQLSFDSDDAFDAWLDDSMRRSYVATNTVPRITDKIITLSTCSYEFDDARFVVVGVLKDME